MSDPTNTDGATVNTDAQTTAGPAGGDFQYPDGSTPAVGDDGLAILEDRGADFPGDFPEVEAEPIIETRDGVKHRLGTGSGMVGYRGLAAKRAEKASAVEPEPVAPDTDEEREAALALAAEAGIDPDSLVGDDGQWLDVAAIHERIAAEQSQESTPDALESTSGDDDTSEDQGEPETGDQGSSDVEESTGDQSEPEGDDETPADEGFDPAAHTVTEVSAYLDENPDQATYVLDRERTGKARVTLIGA